MKVRDIPVYYINPDSYKQRRIEIEEMLNNIGMKFERIESSTSGDSKPIRTANAFIKVANKAITTNVYPFLVLEDDARLITTLPEEVNIPNEVKIIYWGASTYECGGIKPKLKLYDYNKDYYRVKFSLGGHARLIVNKESALHYISVLNKAISKKAFSDVYFAVDSGEFLYLTPKDGPYFYQNDRNRGITNFLWKDKAKKYLINE